MDFVFTDYIRAELLVLIPVLYALGAWVKASKIDNKFIPLILGGTGIALSLLYVLPSSELSVGWRGVMLSIFTAITQGILCAAAAVYANQMLKQLLKPEEEPKSSQKPANKNKRTKTGRL